MKLSGKDIAARIETLRLDRKETRDEIAALLGKNKQVFIDWRNCDRILSVEDLYKLSIHFGVTMEYIATGNERIISDDSALILSKLQALKPEQRQPLKAMIDGLVEFYQNDNGENL